MSTEATPVLSAWPKPEMKKKRICFENTPRRIPTSHMPEFHLWQVHRQLQVTRLSEVNGTSNWTFLTSWPWHLTYDLDLLTWPRYPSTWPPCHSSLYVRLFTQESETDAHTQTDTHTHTDEVKTITPITSRDVGCNKYDLKPKGEVWMRAGSTCREQSNNIRYLIKLMYLSDSVKATRGVWEPHLHQSYKHCVIGAIP